MVYKVTDTVRKTNTKRQMMQFGRKIPKRQIMQFVRQKPEKQMMHFIWQKKWCSL